MALKFTNINSKNGRYEVVGDGKGKWGYFDHKQTKRVSYFEFTSRKEAVAELESSVEYLRNLESVTSGYRVVQ